MKHITQMPYHDRAACVSVLYYDVATHAFVVAPGTFNVMIGSEADDVRLRADLEIK